MILKGANMINKLISYFGTFTPGADGAVGAFQFEYLTSLGFAALVIFAGRAIVRRSHVLRKFAIPAPVISGLLFSVLIAIFKGTGIFAISFDTKNSGGGSYMKQGRDTTQEERIQIVKDCLASGKDYGEMALKYKVSYQQVRTWTLRFEEMGEAGLEDRRGKRKKDQVPRTELEKAQIEIEQLKHKLYLAEMERDLLKKLDEIERRDAFRK